MGGGQLTHMNLLSPFDVVDGKHGIKVHSLEIDAWRFASVFFSLLDLSILYFSNYSQYQVLLSRKFFPLALVLFSIVLLAVFLEGGLLWAW